MGEIINGYGAARIDVADRSYSFPVTMSKGIEEHLLFEEDEIMLEKDDEILTRIDGVRKKFILHYDDLMDGSYYWGLLDVLEGYMASVPIRLYPYVMNLGYSYLVKWDNRDLILRYFRNKSDNVGMQMTNLEFTTLEALKIIGWQKTDDLIIKLPFFVR